MQFDIVLPEILYLKERGANIYEGQCQGKQLAEQGKFKSSENTYESDNH